MLVLLFSLVTVSLPYVGYAQVSATQTASEQYAKGLAAIEEKIEARRKEVGIPGMPLAIVHNDTVIYSKGLGFKDFENKTAVTPVKIPFNTANYTAGNGNVVTILKDVKHNVKIEDSVFKSRRLN